MDFLYKLDGSKFGSPPQTPKYGMCRFCGSQRAVHTWKVRALNRAGVCTHKCLDALKAKVAAGREERVKKFLERKKVDSE